MKNLKKMIALFVIAVSFVSCIEDVMQEKTIADRIQVNALLNGKVLNPGDTIVINEFKNPSSYVGIRYQINGLQSGEQVEVLNKFGFDKESMMPIGETYETFTQQKDTFWYSFGTGNFVNMFRKEEMHTTLKLKCSDGSEKWLNYPVKLLIDSTKHPMSLELTTVSYEKLPSEITLNKGEGMFITAWMETQDQFFLSVYCESYFNGSLLNYRALPGFDDMKPILGNTREIYIPYEKNLTKRIVSVGMVGRYSSSDVKTFTVNWE